MVIARITRNGKYITINDDKDFTVFRDISEAKRRLVIKGYILSELTFIKLKEPKYALKRCCYTCYYFDIEWTEQGYGDCNCKCTHQKQYAIKNFYSCTCPNGKYYVEEDFLLAKGTISSERTYAEE